MAPIKANNSTSRQHTVHFSPPKQANPFIVRDTIETPPLTESRHGLRPGRALLSEQVTLERQRTSQRKPPRSRDVLSPKHAGISKSGHRTPLASRSRNSKMSAQHRTTGTSGKRSVGRAHRRMSKVQPDHPILKLLEGNVLLFPFAILPSLRCHRLIQQRPTGALSTYHAHTAIDLPSRLATAKSSIENQLDYITKVTSAVPSTVLAASAALLSPLGETPLQITLQESAEVFEQPLSRRVEDFRSIVLRERKRLEGLWKRHGDVVGKIENVQTSIADSKSAGDNADDATYIKESQRIKQEYQSEREKLLSEFEAAAGRVRESVVNCETVSNILERRGCGSSKRLGQLMITIGVGEEAEGSEGEGGEIQEGVVGVVYG
jgi:hypothetical protein